MSSGDQTLTVRKEDVAWRVVDDGLIVLDLRTSRYLTLNGSGAVLWQVLTEGATTEQLASSLVEKYGLEAERATADASAFVRHCDELGLIVGNEGPPVERSEA